MYTLIPLILDSIVPSQSATRETVTNLAFEFKKKVILEKGKRVDYFSNNLGKNSVLPNLRFVFCILQPQQKVIGECLDFL
jgi:hypothetical protein